VAIGASAGGIPALLELIPALTIDFPIPILVALHISPVRPSSLASVLAQRSRMPVVWAEHGVRPSRGTIHVCPPATHIFLSRSGGIELAPAANGDRFRPDIDLLFESVAEVCGSRGIGLVLSGMLSDGARGLASISRRGGIAMTQTVASARHGDMPIAAADFGGADIILPPAKLAQALQACVC